MRFLWGPLEALTKPLARDLRQPPPELFVFLRRRNHGDQSHAGQVYGGVGSAPAARAACWTARWSAAYRARDCRKSAVVCLGHGLSMGGRSCRVGLFGPHRPSSLAGVGGTGDL